MDNRSPGLKDQNKLKKELYCCFQVTFWDVSLWVIVPLLAFLTPRREATSNAKSKGKKQNTSFTYDSYNRLFIAGNIEFNERSLAKYKQLYKQLS